MAAEPPRPTIESYDAVVVGSGFGGSVAACRLAEKVDLVLGTKAQFRWSGDWDDFLGAIWAAGIRQIQSITINCPRRRPREFGERYEEFMPLR